MLGKSLVFNCNFLGLSNFKKNLHRLKNTKINIKYGVKDLKETVKTIHTSFKKPKLYLPAIPKTQVVNFKAKHNFSQLKTDLNRMKRTVSIPVKTHITNNNKGLGANPFKSNSFNKAGALGSNVFNLMGGKTAIAKAIASIATTGLRRTRRIDENRVELLKALPEQLSQSTKEGIIEGISNSGFGAIPSKIATAAIASRNNLPAKDLAKFVSISGKIATALEGVTPERANDQILKFMKQFGIKEEDYLKSYEEIGNYTAYVANNSQAKPSEIFEFLNESGTTLKKLGFSLQDSVSLAGLSDVYFKSGAEGATKFQSFIRGLVESNPKSKVIKYIQDSKEPKIIALLKAVHGIGEKFEEAGGINSEEAINLREQIIGGRKEAQEFLKMFHLNNNKLIKKSLEFQSPSSQFALDAELAVAKESLGFKTAQLQGAFDKLIYTIMYKGGLIDVLTSIIGMITHGVKVINSMVQMVQAVPYKILSFLPGWNIAKKKLDRMKNFVKDEEIHKKIKQLSKKTGLSEEEIRKQVELSMQRIKINIMLEDKTKTDLRVKMKNNSNTMMKNNEYINKLPAMVDSLADEIYRSRTFNLNTG